MRCFCRKTAHLYRLFCVSYSAHNSAASTPSACLAGWRVWPASHHSMLHVACSLALSAGLIICRPLRSVCTSSALPKSSAPQSGCHCRMAFLQQVNNSNNNTTTTTLTGVSKCPQHAVGASFSHKLTPCALLLLCTLHYLRPPVSCFLFPSPITVLQRTQHVGGAMSAMFVSVCLWCYLCWHSMWCSATLANRGNTLK